ncbi:hypothetical protein BU26DRAFT_158873 [Trematosphaeria pertusa]|uniref:Uncharacterized protein n=1 Tax=Trematosphaeria pertusa TaxID=390896 RepID=A0A6A6HVW6_9PLEO|nr:uncharacterized protein BU26DRAFT_158873 [Trematosphaeria pertusa]KAF2242334.1 hypothetical protein BU26DRAFT_158873 [Trematosphaeria pertusa]
MEGRLDRPIMVMLWSICGDEENAFHYPGLINPTGLPSLTRRNRRLATRAVALIGDWRPETLLGFGMWGRLFIIYRDFLLRHEAGRRAPTKFSLRLLKTKTITIQTTQDSQRPAIKTRIHCSRTYVDRSFLREMREATTGTTRLLNVNGTH